MQISNEIKSPNFKINVSIARFTGIDIKKTPLFIVHSCQATRIPQLCPTPTEISQKPKTAKRATQSEFKKKIVKRRKSCRKYFKKHKARQLAEARNIKSEIAKQRFQPHSYTFNSKTEMQLMFAASKGFNKTVIFDLDGTLLPYRLCPRSHKKPKLRIHLSELIDALKEEVNLFVFSAGNPTRAQNLLKNHLPEGFSGYFDRSHLKRGRKCLQPLEWQGHDVVIVDDDSRAIHSWSKETHIPIKRWFGESNDTELKNLLQKFHQRWNLK